MKQVYSLLLCLGFVISAGCSTSNGYIEPEDGPTARVRFAIIQPDAGVLDSPNLTIRRYRTPECRDPMEWMRLTNQFQITQLPKRINIPLWEFHPNGAREYYVTADQSLYLGLEGTLGSFDALNTRSEKCIVFLNLNLESGRDYEVVYFQKTRSECVAELREIVPNETGHERKLLETYERSNLFVKRGCVRVLEKYG